MKACIYLRISSDRDGDEYGVTRQREDVEKLIAARGWEKVSEYVDNDVSAAGKVRRPGFEAMMVEVEAGRVDVLVGWAFDRVCRTARDRLRLLEAGERSGLIIALARGSDMDLSTPSGRLAADILGSVAAHEIQQKSDRQRRAAAQAAAQGRWIGGRQPFGYAADGVTIITREADAIVKAYTDVLAGLPLRAIATEWNAAKFTAQKPWKRHDRGEDSPWRADSVRRVLLNPRYAGIRAIVRHDAHGRRIGREEHGRAVWPQVVEESTFRAVQRFLTDPTRMKGGAGMAGRQFLTGLALCGLDGCGHTVHGGGAKHGKPIYRCATAQMLPAQRPDLPGTHVNRLAAPVDGYVGELVIGRLNMPDARDLLVDEERLDVGALQDEVLALRARLDAMAEEFADDPEVSPSEYRVMTKSVRARLAETEAQIADAGRVDLLGDLIKADDAATVWAALSLPRRRAVVDTLMVVRLHAIGRGTRTFRPTTVGIEWKLGDPDMSVAA